MTNRIHATAIVEPGAQLGEDNDIEEYAVVKSGASIGDSNRIGPYTYLHNGACVGSGTTIHGYASIGSLGEMGSKGDLRPHAGVVSIGDRTVIREFVTINFPVRRDRTVIGNDCYLMARTHVPHDAVLGTGVVMATNSLIGGGCTIGDYAYIGLNAHVHQWLTVGESAMLGMGSATVKHVPPFTTVAGVPSRILKVNGEGLRRRGVPEDEIASLERFVFGGGDSLDDDLSKAYEAFLREHPGCLVPAPR